MRGNRSGALPRSPDKASAPPSGRIPGGAMLTGATVPPGEKEPNGRFAA
ncbi:TPA: hypothetical protein I8271_002236 [Kluyvera intermedia]|nr:hypothetical protein [Phytobacter ursingii]HAT2606365.1 hypothetical protein [Kluyvera intermedia]HAT2682090.1 hypothetical protein [Kluyvera intermedia]HAT2696880.1 hypothetical protein [Kluyvera intermedia]HAT2970948.1 hypothetical protein [Kluyvera intermedia]